MEEAEELCDRIGIFINGNFHCIGTPKEVCNAMHACTLIHQTEKQDAEKKTT